MPEGKTNEQRFLLRRRGYEATQMLLFTAFVIITMLSMLYAYGLIDVRRSKTNLTSALIAMTGEIKGVYKGSETLQTLDTNYLINSGSAPPGNVRVVDGEQTLIAPYGGVITFAAIPNEVRSFSATITWPSDGRSPKALCRHMAGVSGGQMIVGPMGSDYELADSNCDTAPLFVTAIYRE